MALRATLRYTVFRTGCDPLPDHALPIMSEPDGQNLCTTLNRVLAAHRHSTRQPVYSQLFRLVRSVDARPRCKNNCNLNGSTGPKKSKLGFEWMWFKVRYVWRLTRCWNETLRPCLHKPHVVDPPRCQSRSIRSRCAIALSKCAWNGSRCHAMSFHVGNPQPLNRQA